MPNKHPPMKLSREEEQFLRHWIYDEAHFLTGVGPAKRLQVEHRVTPADLATIIAAAMPNPHEQAEAASTQPATDPAWPWPGDVFQTRLAEARSKLASQ